MTDLTWTERLRAVNGTHLTTADQHTLADHLDALAAELEQARADITHLTNQRDNAEDRAGHANDRVRQVIAAWENVRDQLAARRNPHTPPPPSQQDDGELDVNEALRGIERHQRAQGGDRLMTDTTIAPTLRQVAAGLHGEVKELVLDCADLIERQAREIDRLKALVATQMDADALPNDICRLIPVVKAAEAVSATIKELSGRRYTLADYDAAEPTRADER